MSATIHTMVECTEVDKLIVGIKVCSTCGAELAACADFFMVDKTRPDGLTGDCRECRNGRGRARYRRGAAA